jgi:hypothetical protein
MAPKSQEVYGAWHEDGGVTCCHFITLLLQTGVPCAPEVAPQPRHRAAMPGLVAHPSPLDHPATPPFKKRCTTPHCHPTPLLSQADTTNQPCCLLSCSHEIAHTSAEVLKRDICEEYGVPLMPDTMPPGAHCNAVCGKTCVTCPSAALRRLAYSPAGGVTQDGSPQPAPVTVRRAAIALLHHRHHMPQSRRGSVHVWASLIKHTWVFASESSYCKPCAILCPLTCFLKL